MWAKEARERLLRPFSAHDSAELGQFQGSEGQSDEGLTAWSPGDAPWDVHRGQADDVGEIYSRAEEFERLSVRMSECAGLLRFGWVMAPETGELKLRLREARYCRVRLCPVCQWRRSLMWRARFYKFLPKIAAEHPKARWVFITLTVRNCPISELGATLKIMNEAWRRFIQREEFLQVLGWVRTVEVTRGKDNTAHPHFHVLVMVPPSYFRGQSYVRQSRWAELWGQCLRANYVPVVDVRAVKPREPAPGQTPADAMGEALQRAVIETLKYAVKPSDMVQDEKWFLELSRQLHKRRFVAAGGLLKDALKLEQESDEDLSLMTDAPSEGEDDGSRVAFGWKQKERRYRREPGADREPTEPPEGRA